MRAGQMQFILGSTIGPKSVVFLVLIYVLSGSDFLPAILKKCPFLLKREALKALIHTWFGDARVFRCHCIITHGKQLLLLLLLLLHEPLPHSLTHSEMIVSRSAVSCY